MDKEQRSILIGMILGDGYLQKQNNIVTLKLQHSQAQIEYLTHKVNLVHSIFGGKLPTVHIIDRYDSRTNKIYKSCWASKTNSYLRILRNWIYFNNKKEYTRSILDLLSPHGIAIWYMDDGNCKLYISDKTGRISSCQTYIGTYCPKDQAKIIKSYFLETYNIEFRIYERQNGQCCLCANTNNSKKFIELIRPYIIDSMKYKIRHVPESSEIHECQTLPLASEDIV